MISIENDSKTRIREIENFYKCICMYENGADITDVLKKNTINKVQLNTSCKANMILMVYNLIEAITTQCIAKIHSEINDNNIKYDELNDSLKVLYMAYYHKLNEKKNNVDDIARNSVEIIDFIRGKSYVNIEFRNFSKAYSLFSGNLDSREINRIFKKYGMDINLTYTELKEVKDYRNKLAHGETSFEEIGRTLSVQRLDICFKNSISAVLDIINNVDDYIKNKKYLNCATSNIC